MKDTLSSCIRTISLDYRSKYSRSSLMWFFGYYLIDTGIFAVTNYRIARCLKNCSLDYVAKILMSLTERLSYIRISPDAIIAPGLSINHGFGVIIGGTSKIGSHCTIQQGVTIGGNFNKVRADRSGHTNSYPQIGNHVHLGAGCAVLGPVIIGNSVIVGANTIVTRDVPEYSIIVGGREAEIYKLDVENEEHVRRFSTVIPNPMDSD